MGRRTICPIVHVEPRTLLGDFPFRALCRMHFKGKRVSSGSLACYFGQIVGRSHSELQISPMSRSLRLWLEIRGRCIEAVDLTTLLNRYVGPHAMRNNDAV